MSITNQLEKNRSEENENENPKEQVVIRKKRKEKKRYEDKTKAKGTIDYCMIQSISNEMEGRKSELGRFYQRKQSFHFSISFVLRFFILGIITVTSFIFCHLKMIGSDANERLEFIRTCPARIADLAT